MSEFDTLPENIQGKLMDRFAKESYSDPVADEMIKYKADIQNKIINLQDQELRIGMV